MSIGEASRDQRPMCVYCSSAVVSWDAILGPQPTIPTTNMSGIGPMARMVESQPAVLREPDAAYAFPCIADVACRAPAVRITLPDRSVAVGVHVREAEDDVAIDFPEHAKHLPDVVVVQRMPVVFQVVNSPILPTVFTSASTKSKGRGAKLHTDPPSSYRPVFDNDSSRAILFSIHSFSPSGRSELPM